MFTRLGYTSKYDEYELEESSPPCRPRPDFDRHRRGDRPVEQLLRAVQREQQTEDDAG
ncbi:hypothetical protein [Mycobacterium lehmannii]|uniref:hypothetical protein n=1 Tax=Mycobacterium lehmannii TaxID=2048550 RepID=UPI001304035C|nr:hypothetical protein [Mycobacterium lehmannii]